MDKLYFFPSEPLTGYQNPYCNCFKQALSKDFYLLDQEKSSAFRRMFKFLEMSMKADVFVLNWIESAIFWRYGFILFIFNMIALRIVKIRRKRIIWVFHNIHPHNGSNRYSKYTQKWLYKNATIIVSHSKDAANYALKRAKGKVVYQCHPVEIKKIVKEGEGKLPNIDIFIWGAIEPYKGIVEFLHTGIAQRNHLQVKIIGKCKELSLSQQIKAYESSMIAFENRHADFSEIKQYCQLSKYILFPYIGESVSSSGALIDTIALGGTPIGPNIGAFKDLSLDKVCLTYRDYTELEEKLRENVSINEIDRQRFVDRNSWKRFSQRLVELIDESDD